MIQDFFVGEGIAVVQAQEGTFWEGSDHIAADPLAIEVGLQVAADEAHENEVCTFQVEEGDVAREMGYGGEMRGGLGFFGANDEKARRLYLARGLGGSVVMDEETFFEGDLEGVGDFFEEFFFGMGEIAIAVGELDEVSVKEEAFGEGELRGEVTDEEGRFESRALAEVLLDALEGFIGVCAELVEEFF